ncbi:MAG: siroheme synthase CysG [Actinomycetota bacterium]
MPFRYPISLELSGRRCVVVGGGDAAEHKVNGLLQAGADVTVVAGSFTEGLEGLAGQGRVTLVRRDYEPGDLRGAFVAIAATEDSAANARIRQEAERERVLLNAVDDPPNCDFAVPSIIRSGDLMLAISTGGKAPALSKRLRQELTAQFGPEYGRLIDLLEEVRAEMLPKRTVDFETWAARWAAALDHPLGALVAESRTEEAKDLVRRCLEGNLPKQTDPETYAVKQGSVAIVGAGPGDPDLITVKGRRLVQEADVIVYDRLVAPQLIAGKNAIFAGKNPHGGSMEQQDINALLVDLASKGQKVVRLKGGDPFVFGRGAEEAEAVLGHGIPVEIVPAPSSAFAAPEAAGIPVTDRRYGSSVAFATGHCAGSRVDWRGLSASADTVVILMGVGGLPEIVSEMLASGRDPACPAAIIENATLESQRVTESPLRELAEAAEAAGVRAPAVVVIGKVVKVRRSTLHLASLAGVPPA